MARGIEIDRNAVRSLFRQGKKNHEIAEAMVCNPGSISAILQGLGLRGRQGRVRIEKALSLEKRIIIAFFFRDLLRCDDQKPPGCKINIPEFIKIWRDTRFNELTAMIKNQG